MNDPLLEAQANLAFNFPLQALCFGVGGFLVVAGLFIATIRINDKWQQRGMALLFAGQFIAFPAVIPMMDAFMGGGESMRPEYIQDILSYLYFIIPCVGIFIGFNLWRKAGKEEVDYTGAAIQAGASIKKKN
ncbi:MAG: hypothetical protein V3U92_05590 [Cellulophaga sp.]